MDRLEHSMSLREFYENNGADYDTFLRRLMGKETLVEKYLRLFLSDPTFYELKETVALQDLEAMSQKAHTLKGIALNLELLHLSDCCKAFMEDARSGGTEDAGQLFDQVASEYERICSALHVELAGE